MPKRAARFKSVDLVVEIKLNAPLVFQDKIRNAGDFQPLTQLLE